MEELLASGPSGKRRKIEEDAGHPEVATAATLFTCPVCQMWRTEDGEVELNRHVDECLNQQVLSEQFQSTTTTTTAATTSGGKRQQQASGLQTKIDRFIVRKSK